MKYEINRIEQAEKFKPFSVTLTFETHEEYTNFHDNVINKITRVPIHRFHGDVYKVGSGKIDEATGEI